MNMSLKNYLQRQEKFLDKTRDISNIFEMMGNCGGDLLRQYVLEPTRHDEIVDMIHKIVEYGNEVFETLRKRYTCKISSKIFYVWNTIGWYFFTIHNTSSHLPVTQVSKNLKIVSKIFYQMMNGNI